MWLQSVSETIGKFKVAVTVEVCEVALMFWSSLCRNFPGIFGNQQQHYLEVIKRMLVQCMQDQEHPSVRLLFLIVFPHSNIQVYCSGFKH